MRMDDNFPTTKQNWQDLLGCIPEGVHLLVQLKIDLYLVYAFYFCVRVCLSLVLGMLIHLGCSACLLLLSNSGSAISCVDASQSPALLHLCSAPRGEPLCRKHNKPYEYIHRPCKASSIRKFKGKKIHLKPGKYILRGEPCIHYLDEFSRHIVWGNTFKLYNHNVRRLRKIIRSTTTSDHYYVCHMTETFATDGKRMYFSVPFSTGSLFPHMDADRGELPITTRDGTTAVTARFIKGVHKRATITKGWSNFFRQAHMNKGQAYAFAFKCTSKGLRLIVPCYIQYKQAARAPCYIT